MNVFFAPDYREGVAYQALLAGALAEHGVEVTFPLGHRRVLPLWRGIQHWRGDLLHLHWPEKFFEVRRDGLDFWRKVRYPLDLWLTARRLPIVLTAHDLRPHIARASFSMAISSGPTMRQGRSSSTRRRPGRRCGRLTARDGRSSM